MKRRILKAVRLKIRNYSIFLSPFRFVFLVSLFIFRFTQLLMILSADKVRETSGVRVKVKNLGGLGKPKKSIIYVPIINQLLFQLANSDST